MEQQREERDQKKITVFLTSDKMFKNQIHQFQVEKNITYLNLTTLIKIKLCFPENIKLKHYIKVEIDKRLLNSHLDQTDFSSKGENKIKIDFHTTNPPNSTSFYFDDDVKYIEVLKTFENYYKLSEENLKNINFLIKVNDRLRNIKPNYLQKKKDEFQTEI